MKSRLTGLIKKKTSKILNNVDFFFKSDLGDSELQTQKTKFETEIKAGPQKDANRKLVESNAVKQNISEELIFTNDPGNDTYEVYREVSGKVVYLYTLVVAFKVNPRCAHIGYIVTYLFDLGVNRNIKAIV